ncbi:hypothetical protein IAR55_005946 [Kwoniella newhampshirensis]|uniref:FAS1 domain-containing protein n=1 Tax=Kwoniella newhampshirensis TaxID=1651941 RepID=A0AAW0YVV2_9TREE
MPGPSPRLVRNLRFLRLHTLAGQVIFLTTISVGCGLVMVQFRDDHPNQQRRSMNAALKREGRTSSGEGDLVDAISDSAGRGGVKGKMRNGITLSDALTAERGTSLWWGYARDNPGITRRLESRFDNLTILVPIDQAVLAMDTKPHLASNGNSKSTSGAGSGWSSSLGNLGSLGGLWASSDGTDRFLTAHIIEGNLSAGKHKTLLDGFEVELAVNKKAKGGWNVKPGNIEVLGVKETVNGRIMYISKVLPY